MKIPRFDIREYVFYPFLLNPFAWIIVVLVLAEVLFFSWWSAKRDGGYWDISTHKPTHTSREHLFVGVAMIVLNTYWLNRKITTAHVTYLQTKYVSYYVESDWRYKHYMEQNYKRYLKVKDGKGEYL